MVRICQLFDIIAFFYLIACVCLYYYLLYLLPFLVNKNVYIDLNKFIN